MIFYNYMSPIIYNSISNLLCNLTNKIFTLLFNLEIGNFFIDILDLCLYMCCIHINYIKDMIIVKKFKFKIIFFLI